MTDVKTDVKTDVNSPFEPEFTTALCEIFEQLISFNQLLGVKIDELRHEIVRAHIPMRPELVGHYAHNRLHGGVISATLDSMGGLAVMAAIGARHLDEPPQQRLQRFAKLGTIDLRVDYLRPAIGAMFRCEAEVMRLGSRVANTRMAFTDEQGRLLATGAAAYIVS
ncbi:MAG: thioesterase family protein [Rubrivivax sp.]|nr:MAG: thioesterase family protein [Rubrivivax sp.]